MLMLAWDCAGAGVPPVVPLLPFATGMVTPHPAQNAKTHPLKRTTRGPVQRLNGRIDNSKELSCQGSAFWAVRTLDAPAACSYSCSGRADISCRDPGSPDK